MADASSKLTLSVKKSTIDWAKQYAQEHHLSLSKIVENHFEEIKKSVENDPLIEKYKDVKISDDILSLRGILKGKYPNDITLWDAKYEYLKDKYDL